MDQALKAKPDTLFLNSYEPDLVVLLRDLYRAGFNGKRLTIGYAANDKLLAALPPEVTERPDELLAVARPRQPRL